jgi:hypothetical protein
MNREVNLLLSRRLVHIDYVCRYAHVYGVDLDARATAETAKDVQVGNHLAACGLGSRVNESERI